MLREALEAAISEGGFAPVVAELAAIADERVKSRDDSGSRGYFLLKRALVRRLTELRAVEAEISALSDSLAALEEAEALAAL